MSDAMMFGDTAMRSLPRPADAVLSLAEAGRLADVLHELIELTRAAEQA
jgi:hypothetical protein